MPTVFSRFKEKNIDKSQDMDLQSLQDITNKYIENTMKKKDGLSLRVVGKLGFCRYNKVLKSKRNETKKNKEHILSVRKF
mgnify:CR=1 FL=1